VATRRSGIEKQARCDRLATAETAEQSQVDRIFGSRSGSTSRMPKGLSAHTAALVEEQLRTFQQTLSASECAERVGISRVSARRYLEHFVTTGAATVGLKYGSTGRPERLYQWKQE
jgi:response regulator of citrate/malate metabolism